MPTETVDMLKNVNPFHAYVPFPYLLPPENVKKSLVSEVYRGYKSGTLKSNR